MLGAEKIDKILNYCGLTAAEFSRCIRLDRPQSIYDIKNGKTRDISSKMASRINSVFPEINIAWLRDGEGEMLKRSEGDCMAETNPKTDDMEKQSLLKMLADAIDQNKLLIENNTRLVRIIEQIHGIASSDARTPPLPQILNFNEKAAE